MLEYLPLDLREGIELARKRQARRSRLRLRLGNAVLPVITLDASTLVVDAGDAPRMRGLVDVFDGARHVFQALIVATRREDGLLVCSFKRCSTVHEAPPVDYVRDDAAPAGLLPRL